MADIVINPSVGKIDFFTTKGDQSAANSLRLTGTTVLFAGPLSASSISTGGGGSFVTSVQPTSNYLSKFTGNSTIANSLVYDNGTNVGIGTSTPVAKLHINSTTSGATLLRTDGTSGTLFSVVDDLSDSLMSVNNSAGLPVLEVFADDRIVGGQYGVNDFVVVNNKVGIGTNNPTAKLQVSGSTSTTAAAFLGGNVGIGTTSPAQLLELKKTTASAIAVLNYNDTVKFNINASSGNVGYVGMITNHPLLFVVNDVEKVRIDTSGNVGIGTTSPSGLFHVYSSTSYNAILETTTANNVQLRFRKSGTDKWSIYVGTSSNDLTLWDGTSDRVTFQTGGNVGIGTSSPSSLLNVSGTGTLGSGFQEKITNGTTTLALGTNATAAEVQSQGSVPLYLNYGGNNVCIVPAGSGNVGIGTTSPTALLNTAVTGQIQIGTSNWPTTYVGKSGARTLIGNDAVLLLWNDISTIGANVEASLFLGARGSGANGATSIAGGSIRGLSEDASTNKGYLKFETNGGSGFAEAMRIKSDGNVGIGTTAPAYKLHVNGDLRAGAGSFTNTVTGTKGIFSDASGVGGVIEAYNTVATNATTAIIRQTTAGGNGNQDIGLLVDIQGANDLDRIANFRYYDGATYTSRMAIMRGGNVGIGTSSPSYKLHVNGTIHVPIDTAINFGAASQIYYNSTTSGLQFTGNTGNNTVFIKATDGNVGIGTTSPDVALYVLRASGDSTATFKAASGGAEINLDATNGYAALKLYSSGTEKWRVGQVGDSTGFQIWQGGTGARVYINSSGNVGIGTTSPADKLHVIGNIRINGGDILNWGGQAFIQTIGANDMFFRPNSTLRMILTAGGNLGIGNGFINPLAKLHINSTTSGETLLRADGTSGTLFSVVDDLSDSLMSVNNSAGLPVLEVFADDRIVGGQYGQNDLVVVNNKVGIGTNNPVAKLHVTGSSSVPAAVFLGDVGIGTTAPTAQSNYRFLQVNGPVSAIIETTVGGTRIGGFDSTSNTLYVGSIGSFPIVFRIAVVEKMRIDTSGNLLVARTSAGLTNATGVTIGQSSIGMQTEGNAAQIIMNRTTSDGTIVEIRRNNIAVGTISVTTTATAYNTTSDYRLKESIKPLSAGLSRINLLKPSVYTWKSDGSNGEGFMAHELAEVVPLAVTGQKDAVNDDGSINPQSVDLSKVVPILVASIQELSDIVKRQENRIEQLETKISAFQNK